MNLKHNAEEERRQGDFDEPDEEYYADLADRELRRKLSKLEVPDGEEAPVVPPDDANSVDTNGDQHFWPDGSPLGIGPQADDSTIDSQVFNDDSLDDSSLEQEAGSGEEDAGEEDAFYDEDGNRRQPYLWETIKRRQTAAYTEEIASEVRTLVALDGQDVNVDEGAVGTSAAVVKQVITPNSTPTSSRRASGHVSRSNGSFKTAAERRQSTSSSSARKVSLGPSRMDFPPGFVGSHATEDGSLTPVSYLCKSMSPSRELSMDISDDLDDDEEYAIDAGSVTDLSDPLNLQSMIQPNGICSVRTHLERVADRPSSDRSPRTADSTDEGDLLDGSDYHPISAVDVSFVKGATGQPVK